MSSTEIGNEFEEYCKYYLYCLRRIKFIGYAEFPNKEYFGLPAKDHGVDLAYEDKSVKILTVVQCKYRTDINKKLTYARDKIAHLLATSTGFSTSSAYKDGYRLQLILISNATGYSGDKHGMEVILGIPYTKLHIAKSTGVSRPKKATRPADEWYPEDKVTTRMETRLSAKDRLVMKEAERLSIIQDSVRKDLLESVSSDVGFNQFANKFNQIRITREAPDSSDDEDVKQVIKPGNSQSGLAIKTVNPGVPLSVNPLSTGHVQHMKPQVQPRSDPVSEWKLNTPPKLELVPFQHNPAPLSADWLVPNPFLPIIKPPYSDQFLKWLENVRNIVKGKEYHLNKFNVENASEWEKHFHILAADVSFGFVLPDKNSYIDIINAMLKTNQIYNIHDLYDRDFTAWCIYVYYQVGLMDFAKDKLSELFPLI